MPAMGGGVGNFNRGAGVPVAGSVMVDPDTGSSTQPVGQSGWTLAMSEEFNGAINITDSANGIMNFRPGGPLWQGWYPTDAVGDGNKHSNNPGTELEYYDTTALSLSSGAMVLSATHDNVHSGFAYTSGMISSYPGFNQKYGYMEAKMKGPAADGSWPAFWMIATALEWPPEIDIFENFGDATFYKVSNFSSTSGATVFGTQVNTTITNTYHVFGFKWASGVATWYLDGTQVANETASATVPAESMYLICNLAVRNSNTSSFTASVDYVRAWR